MVDLETKAWDTKNPDLFLSIIHADMVWPSSISTRYGAIKEDHQDFSWKGRVCKIYTRLSTGEWKLIFQTGAFMAMSEM